MPRHLFSLAFLITIPLLGFAQFVQPSTLTLVFPPANETDTLSRILSFTNPGDDAVRISEFRFYQTYEISGFSGDKDSLLIPPGETRQIEVFFHPGHNIFHNSELLILGADSLGALHIDLRGQGIYSNTYYQDTRDLSQQALKDALKDRLTRQQVSYSYNEARNEMFEVIDNQKLNGQGALSNTLECVYTGTLIDGFSNRTSAQNMGFNTEHTFPQSFFNQDLPMRSDLFHLFPTTATSNSVRSNFPFGEVPNPGWQQGGSSQGGGKFEPRDEHKGRVARALFYFVIRYSNYASFLNSQEGILRQWHLDFLPTQVDRVRNEMIFAFQRNRNPFIDYPQFIFRIQNLSGSSSDTRKSLDLSHQEIRFKDTPAGMSSTFGFVLVNVGNLPVQLTHITTTDTAFQVGIGGGSLDPGEALNLPLSLNASTEGLKTGFLQFNTDIQGQSSISIPLNAKVLPGIQTGISDLLEKVNIYPQPASEYLILERPGGWKKNLNAKLFDLKGREIGLTSHEVVGEKLYLFIDWEKAEKRGIYILRIEGMGSRKIILK